MTLSPGLRSAIGPLCLGVAVWCAAGEISLAAHDTPNARLALPAPWWVAAIATLLAAAIPAWRRHPALAAPALLSTVPWWPLPIPSVALLWTGPMAWVPIGLAIVAAAYEEIARRSTPKPDASAGAQDDRTWLAAAALTLAIGVACAWSLTARIPGGDEPHYLIITQSLINDGDLQIENNHRGRDYAAYYSGTLAPDVIRRGRDGQIYSIHAPGLSVLVLPAFWLFGYRGAQATVLTVAALAGGLIWLIGWRATGSKAAAWFTWAAVSGSVTAVIQSATVFPDGPAALVIAAGIYVLLRLQGSDRRQVSDLMLAGTSVLFAALPWLHTRFAVLAAGFGCLIAWTIVRDSSTPAGIRSRRLLWFFAVPAASAIGWFAFFQVIYGTPNPAAPYGDRPEASLWFVPGGLAGLFFDQQFGLVAYAPVLLAAFVGLRAGSGGPVARMTLGAAALYLVAVATYWMWYAGVPATPARFAAAILPVFAVPLARLWSAAGPSGRAALATLLAVSLAITAVVIGVDRGGLAWNVRGPSALWLEWLGPVVNLARGWPSFFWKLTPEDLSTEIPYAIHVGAWLVLAATVAAIVRLAARRISSTTAMPVMTVWCVAMGLMAMVQTGWWLNRVGGPEPIRSQLVLLAQQRAGHQVLAIGPMSFGASDDLAGIMRIRPGEPAPADAAVWAAVQGVPAGTYELRIVTARPRQGELALRIGRAERPWRTLTVLPLSRQTFVISLPADIASLTIEPVGELKNVGGSVELAPLEIRKDTSAQALSVVRYGSTDVFFLDQNAFVEPEGFWVQGGRTAQVALAAGAGRASITLMLRNGSAPNTVRVQSGSEEQTITMQPNEERSLAVAVQAADGVVQLRISSDSGFRPSDLPTGDRRYLGVWTAIASDNSAIR